MADGLERGGQSARGRCEHASRVLKKIGLRGVDAIAVGAGDRMRAYKTSAQEGLARHDDGFFYTAGIGEDRVGIERAEHAADEIGHCLDRSAEDDAAGAGDDFGEIGAGLAGEAQAAHSLEGRVTSRPDADFGLGVALLQREPERTSDEAGTEDGDRAKGIREAQGTRKILPE